MITAQEQDHAVTPIRPAPARSRSEFYVAGWVLLAFGALTYLAALAFAPAELSATLFPGAKETASLSNDSRPLAQIVADAEAAQRALADDVDSIRDDIANIRQQVAILSTNDRTLDGRIDAVELTQGGGEASPQAASVTLRKDAPAAVEGTVIEPTRKVAELEATDEAVPSTEAMLRELSASDEDDGAAAAAAAKKALAKKTAEQEAARQKVTAEKSTETTATDKKLTDKKTAEKKAADKKVAAAKVATGTNEAWDANTAPVAEKKAFGLELAQSTSPEALRVNWDIISGRHVELLKGLSPRAVASSSGDNYRLLAGPFTSAKKATQVCAKLQAEGVSCKAAAFTGEKL